MTIFLIYAHADPVMTARLCSALHPYMVFLHVDLKSDVRQFKVELSKIQSEHVNVLEERVRVNWAGYSQVDAMRLLIEAAANHAAPQEHMVMLSGQDYPVRPVSQYVDMLENHAGVQFIKCFDIDKSAPQYVKQIATRHHRDLKVLGSYSGKLKKFRNGLIRIIDRLSLKKMPNAPVHLRLMHGQTHWALTSECAIEVSRSITSEVEKFFRYCFSPDEKVFHTLVANSRFGDSSSGYGTVPYSGPGNWRYTNFHHIDPSLTKIYDLTDWGEVSSSDKYFVRKVESRKSRTLLDRIDAELL